MGQFESVARVDEIPEGERKRFEVNGERITVFNIENRFYAIHDTCPHKKTAPLLRGTLDGLGIKCPNHGYRFDLQTGTCNVDPKFNTRVFPIRVEDGQIQIQVNNTSD